MWKLRIIRGAGQRSCSCTMPRFFHGHPRGAKNVFSPIRAMWVFSHLIQKVYLSVPIRCCVLSSLIEKGGIRETGQVWRVPLSNIVCRHKVTYHSQPALVMEPCSMPRKHEQTGDECLDWPKVQRDDGTRKVPVWICGAIFWGKLVACWLHFLPPPGYALSLWCAGA